MLAGAHNPLAPDAGDNNGMDYDIIQGGAAVILVDYFIFCIFFYFPVNKYEYNIFNKISAVKKKWKGQNVLN